MADQQSMNNPPSKNQGQFPPEFSYDQSPATNEKPLKLPLSIQIRKYFYKISHGAVSLVKGLWLTLGIMLNPKRVITQQYPENRETLTMHKRFRGMVAMPHDEEGEHKCTGCSLCEKACPNGTISIHHQTNIASKKVLGEFVYRYGQCTFCNLCIEACPFGAIEMSKDYENATVDRASLDLVLNKKEGRA